MMKKKIDINNVLITTFTACIFLLMVFFCKEKRFQQIPFYIIIGIIVSFLSNIFILFIFHSHKNLRFLKILCLIFVDCFIFTSVCIYSFSISAIFQPHFDKVSYENLKSVPDAEEISFEGENGRISGWYYKNDGEDNPVLLCFYGNGENASTVLYKTVKDGSLKYFSGYDIAIFDYPGYGLSEGTTRESSLKKFSLSVYDKITETHSKVVVQGYSLGTGAACYLASQRHVDGLILYAPYSNGTDLYNNFIPIFDCNFFKPLISFNPDNIKYADSVEAPVLICASPTDKVVSYDTSIKLSKHFDKCNFFTTNPISHQDLRTDNEVKDKTEKYLKEVVRFE